MSRKNRQPESVAHEPVVAEQRPRYCVVSEMTTKKLVERIEALMAEGWALQGGIALGEFHEPVRGQRMPGYHQAMVRQ